MWQLCCLYCAENDAMVIEKGFMFQFGALMFHFAPVQFRFAGFPEMRLFLDHKINSQYSGFM